MALYEKKHANLNVLCHIVYLHLTLLFFINVTLVQFHFCSLPISIKPALPTSYPIPYFALDISLRKRQEDCSEL